jgi:hypothetical protein
VAARGGDVVVGESRQEVLKESVYQGESWMLDSPDDVCAGQTRFEYPASVLFSN